MFFIPRKLPFRKCLVFYVPHTSPTGTLNLCRTIIETKEKGEKTKGTNSKISYEINTLLVVRSQNIFIAADMNTSVLQSWLGSNLGIKVRFYTNERSWVLTTIIFRVSSHSNYAFLQSEHPCFPFLPVFSFVLIYVTALKTISFISCARSGTRAPLM